MRVSSSDDVVFGLQNVPKHVSCSAAFLRAQQKREEYETEMGLARTDVRWISKSDYLPTSSASLRQNFSDETATSLKFIALPATRSMR